MPQSLSHPTTVDTLPTRSERSVNILIVDDEPRNLDVLEIVLNDPGYRLVRAESADDALLALVAEEFALLILDIRMPGMTGFELANTIKERRKTARVPIIFLTAYYNEDQHVLTGYGTGAVDYLHKPVNPDILRSKVAIFAELHRKTREVELANQKLSAEIADRCQIAEQLRVLNETLEQRVQDRTLRISENERRKDEFLATLAHELRNPLAPIRTAVQILQLEGPLTPDLQWSLEMIDRQIQYLTRLIDDLMDVGRINQGKIALRSEPVELATVVRRAIEMSGPLIEECGHELKLQLPGHPVILDADPIRLSQVFLNLLNNAAKYTHRGGRISLTAEVREGELLVSVRDSGIGIPPDKLPTIFGMFSQVAGALSRSQGGLGIGLFLVERLVSMHQGSVAAFSDGVGKGSEFRVRLPIVARENVASDRDDNTSVGLPSTNLRILVVDDNRDAAVILSKLLKALGNTVRVEHDGEKAVQAVVEFEPQVVLLDIGLPKMNGYDACRAIRMLPGGNRLFLIALTGWGQDEDRRKSLDAGFDLHLVKPVDPRSLLQSLAGWRHSDKELIGSISEPQSPAESSPPSDRVDITASV
jgi:signal transduction histidine kinase